MAWNEPGGSGSKDPWGNRKKEQGPPDLDEIIKKLQSKFAGLFGGGGGAGRRRTTGGGFGLSFIAAVVLVIWALSGIYIVDEGRQGVVLQFGAFRAITDPGPHWYPRFIQSVEIVDVEQVRSVNLGRIPDEALMLTQDENIIDIKFTVQYKVKDAREYLFNVRDPDATLRQATESAVREIVGKNKLDFVITEGRLEVAARAEKLMQEVLDSYATGILVVKLNMQDAQPPQQVQAAFDDAIKAREDEQRQINEAEAYANDIIPRARGTAARRVQEAEAYREEIIQIAQGESNRFAKVLAEYDKAPQVTRERLYLEAMESVLANSNKVMIDVKQGGSLMYLPIDKLMQSQRQKSVSPPNETTSVVPSGTITEQESRLRDRLRSREVR
ncbi:MAG: FtsH protease activity modulator HflK [Halobacteria archaeon]|nr:FtsH protease activity modulator HflK [Halobacteria archaeon]